MIASRSSEPIDRLVPSEHPDEEPDILARLRRGERLTHYETVRVANVVPFGGAAGLGATYAQNLSWGFDLGSVTLSIIVSGLTVPASSAVATVKGLSVEPGSKTSVSARLRMRSRASFSMRLGLNAGQFASARISPVWGSMMIAVPALAWFSATPTRSSRSATY